MNPSGSSLGQREQDPDMRLDSNCCSVSGTLSFQDGTDKSPGPHPSLCWWARVGGVEGGGPASVHTTREWLAGARTLGLLCPSPVLFLENISQ